MGLEVHEGIAGTGVVGVLRAGNGPAVGLRADIDALDITEQTGLPYTSTIDGKMHACGHDGHTAILLGTALHLSKSPPRNGTVVFIFQPAEENEGGARVMVSEGLFRQFPVESVFGLHNWPGLPAGEIALHSGPIMAALDSFELSISGKGSHAAMPHEGIDPITVASQVQNAWQHIVSRRLDPTDAAVISITHVEAGGAPNVIPEELRLRGTVRSLRPETQDLIESEMRHRAERIADAYGGSASLDYQRRYPPTINHPDATVIATSAAEAAVGGENVQTGLRPSMAAEDFAFMLQERPGCYAWLGNGSAANGRNLHSPHYNFNDEILPIGVQFFAEIVRRALPD